MGNYNMLEVNHHNTSNLNRMGHVYQSKLLEHVLEHFFEHIRSI